MFEEEKLPGGLPCPTDREGAMRLMLGACIEFLWTQHILLKHYHAEAEKSKLEEREPDTSWIVQRARAMVEMAEHVNSVYKPLFGSDGLFDRIARG